LVMLLFWFFYFTEDSVLDAAFSYARKLVLACESLKSPTKTKLNHSRKNAAHKKIE